MRSWILAFIVFGLLLAGCAGPASPPANGVNASSFAPAAGNASQTPAAANRPGANAPTTGTPGAINASAAPANATADPIVVFETTKGAFKAVIYVNEAPITGGNFMKLVRAGFYDNLTFHRVVPGFVAQGGDPNGDGTGGSNQTIPLEIVPGLTHQLGSLAMARTSDPNSASSQFYIVLNAANCAQLDGQYAVFGRLTGADQMAVVNQLNPGEPPANPDRMLRVYEQKQ